MPRENEVHDTDKNRSLQTFDGWCGHVCSNGSFAGVSQLLLYPMCMLARTPTAATAAEFPTA
eukprot:4283317-Amphidinium_carterae.1